MFKITNCLCLSFDGLILLSYLRFEISYQLGKLFILLILLIYYCQIRIKIYLKLI